MYRSIASLCLLLLFAPHTQAREASELAKALVGMRSDVERLTDNLEEARREKRTRNRTLASRQAQLEAELQREQLRVRQLREARDRKRAAIQRVQADEQALQPVFATAAGALKAWIQRSMPFRREARLAGVTGLEDRLRDGLLTPRSALARLWALYEDELRMTRDTGLFRETLTLASGEPVIADVVRVGMLGLFYRTGDEQVGRLRWRDQRWVTEPLTSERDRRQVLGLFDAFKKQIRVGHFQLPGLWPAREAGR